MFNKASETSCIYYEDKVKPIQSAQTTNMTWQSGTDKYAYLRILIYMFLVYTYY